MSIYCDRGFNQGLQEMFSEHIRLIFDKIPIIDSKGFMFECTQDQFYLNIPGIARFLALPEKHQIIIEKTSLETDDQILHTWLYGTVIAYILQYHGYLVLHGSAVLMKDAAVIFSGPSGAGKSTLARACLQQGYSLITDDLVVIKPNQQGQYCIIPGPAKLKLWQDTMHYFNHDLHNAMPINQKINKYAIQISHMCHQPMIPVVGFYALNTAEAFHCERLNAAESLKTLIQNTYRYFMLKPLGKLQTFFHDCSALSKQIAVHKLTRTPHFDELPPMVQHIKRNQGLL